MVKRAWMKAWLVVWSLLLSGSLALAQSQAPVGPGMLQFSDGNGAPYSGGKIYMYQPFTTTPKATFKDPNGLVQNTNPTILDANGRGIFWGSGLYRQVLQDANGNVVWDQQSEAAGGSSTSSSSVSCAAVSSTGSVNAQILQPSPAISSLVIGGIYCGLAGFTNTGSLQLQVSATGFHAVEKQSPSGLTPLVGGEVTVGFGYQFQWDGTEFQLLNPSQFALTNGTTATTQPFTDPSAKVTTDAFVAGYYGGVNNAVAKGVVCDGVTDTTAAMKVWALATADNTLDVLPPGKCLISDTVHFPISTHVRLEAQGSEVVYIGGDPTKALLTFGQAGVGGNCSVRGWIVNGLKLESNTLMGAQNWGAIFYDACESQLNVDVGGQLQSGTHNLFNGVWVNGGNQVHAYVNTYVQGIGVTVNGDSPVVYATDIYLRGKITGGLVGVQVAGAVGGMNFDEIDVLSNSINLSINQSIVAQANTQIFFGPLAAFDVTVGGAGYDIQVTDSGGTNSYLFFTGTWVASAANSCIEFANGTVWQVNYMGGTILNCGASGIHFTGNGNLVNIVGTLVSRVVSYGIDNGGASTVNKCAVRFSLNGLGNTFGTVGSSC